MPQVAASQANAWEQPKQTLQSSLAREELEGIGKRRPFGQVNDSRVDSSKRYKPLKI